MSPSLAPAPRASPTPRRHWYYEDFVREENPAFPTCNLKRFYGLLWKAVPLLRDWHPLHEEAFDRFMQYKQFVPVCGAILLNEACDQVRLLLAIKSPPHRPLS